jgi:hypothetical protein
MGLYPGRSNLFAVNGRCRRMRLRHWVAVALPLPVLTGLLVGVPARPAVAVPPPAATPQQAKPTEAADIASARVAARLSGARVEALSERSEDTTTWVNPDGR